MQVYLVGGAVRDKLLEIEGADRDFVVVGATVEEMLAKGFTQVGKDFPVFLHPTTKEEYALARTERKNGKGYTGFVCDFNPNTTLEEDLSRRDLTINAIAQDQDGNLVDPFHGKEDLDNRILRHVSAAFIEDPLRVLRVARFAAKLHCFDFKIAPETLDLMAQISDSGELGALTPERVWIEFEKSLVTPNPEVFIEVLHHVGALKWVLPEIEALWGVPGPKRWHPEIDTFIHTLMTVHRLSFETESPVARFAMMCHDLGKALTPKKSWPHHKDHNLLGLKPLDELCSRLKVPNEYRDFAYIVVKYHSVIHHLYREGAEGVVKLLDDLDAWRRPERIKPWILCCKCDFLGRKGFESRPFPRADYLYEMFVICRTVKAQEFIEQGLKGIEIKLAMHKQRVALVEEFMQTLPSSELDDSANSVPASTLTSEEAAMISIKEHIIEVQRKQQQKENYEPFLTRD